MPAKTYPLKKYDISTLCIPKVQEPFCIYCLVNCTINNFEENVQLRFWLDLDVYSVGSMQAIMISLN